MHVAFLQQRVVEVACRIGIAAASDVAEHLLVARAPVHAVGLIQALRRAVRRARCAAGRIVDNAPGAEAVAALVAAQYAVPVDQYANPLLEDEGMETVVACRGLEPDQAAGAFRFVQPFACTGLKIGRILRVHTACFGRRLRDRGQRDGNEERHHEGNDNEQHTLHGATSLRSDRH
ncbi:hypothetical protein PS639_06253 [Pseudomonas fluorescens]|nr:hypothetical protein PS639_06253 [Pseudomonas fluorescens]